MLRPFYKIQIQQIPTPLWKNRNLNFVLDFETNHEISSDWKTHTNNCTLTFPKNLKLLVSDGAIFAAGATYNLILGGSGVKLGWNQSSLSAQITIAPLIMRGDIITINQGYLCRNEKQNEFVVSTGGISVGSIIKENKISTEINLFKGYVSSVGSNTPIEIKIEDNFYLLKKTPFDTTVWNEKEAGKYGTSLYGLMKHILDLVNTKFNKVYPTKYPELTLLNVPKSITAQFSLGYLEIGDMTCAQLLDKLKSQYNFQSTFRRNTLQFGFPIYIDSEEANGTNISKDLLPNSNNFFCFRDIFNDQGNLIASANIFPTHELEYSNKDDIILTATVQCKIINEVKGKLTLSGKQKTFVEKLKVFVYWDIVTETFKWIDISKPGYKLPKDFGGEGERHQFFYPVDKNNPNPKISDLVSLGIKQLERYHYTGFRGCFTTFGFPFVQWNDNINILDPIYADRNGQYKVKKVVYRGGINGLSQEIHLDYKIPVQISKINKQISMI